MAFEVPGRIVMKKSEKVPPLKSNEPVPSTAPEVPSSNVIVKESAWAGAAPIATNSSPRIHIDFRILASPDTRDFTDGPFTARPLSLHLHINQVKRNSIQNRVRAVLERMCRVGDPSVFVAPACPERRRRASRRLLTG